MLNLPLHKQQFHGPMWMMITACLLFLFDSYIGEYLIYTRPSIEQGQYWRLLTTNWLHSNGYHLLLNLAGIALLWSVHGEYYRISIYLLQFAAFSLYVTLAIYLFDPSMYSYVGLSGALHGLFVCGAVKDIQTGFKTGWLLLVGVWVKIIYEQLSAPNRELAQLIDATVAVDAHLYGALAGSLWVAIVWFIGRGRGRQPQ